MNEQLPPIDSKIREQLARRSAGRLPDNLLAGVSGALEGAGEPRPRNRWPHLRWTAPRLAGAGLGVALVAVLAVAIGGPALLGGPAAPSSGYPADRALTTDELGRLLAGPAPAVNTALVASVTLDPQPDACPMNSRPTYGVIHGIDPQICVVGPIGDTGSVAIGQNVFAFRYLGPGVLGLLGLVQPASASKLAHSVAEDWSGAGEVFLVQGWLGKEVVSCPTYVPADVGDPLNPGGSSGCEIDWMSDEDPNTTPAPDGRAVPTVSKRLVDAGGMRLIDDIAWYPAIHGVYVVRVNTARQCVASTMSRPDCGLVLAKVADISMPTATSTPATPAPRTILARFQVAS